MKLHVMHSPNWFPMNKWTARPCNQVGTASGVACWNLPRAERIWHSSLMHHQTGKKGAANHTEESFPTCNDDEFFELYSIVVGRIVVQVITFARHIIIKSVFWVSAV